MPPPTKYVRSGDIHIAYQVLGGGPIDLVFVPSWISQVEAYWEEPSVARYFERLASFSRLIMFDRRGTGLSDPVAGAPTLEEQMDDVVAVMDAVGSRTAAVFAWVEGGAMAALFAATHPERTRALVLYEGLPRMSWAPDYDWPPRRDEREARIRQIPWGEGGRILPLAQSAASNPRLVAWFGRLERLAASPGTAAKLEMMNAEVDVRAVLPSISVPTLVLHRAEEHFIDIRHSRYLADHIPGARYVELPGSEVFSFTHAGDELLDEVQEFLTGMRQAPRQERVLATVMFADIVDSTRTAAELGDLRWRQVLGSIEESVSRELSHHRGRAVKTLGDGFLATFDGPARGIRCATAIRESIRSQFGLEVRSGLHTGEIELIGSDVGGIGVHIGARVGSNAAPGEVLVSGTVKDLVVGSGIEFEDRGERELRGVPGQWRLWAVAA
jgi:class 3 adenylate cyclase